MIAEFKENLKNLKSIHFKKYNTYREQNVFKKALVSYENYTYLRDSIDENNTRKEVAEITEKYDNEILMTKKNKTETALKYNRTILFGTIILFLLTLIIGSLFFWNLFQKRKRTQLETQQIKQHMELNALNALMDGQEQERKRIAEALHSRMGSLLSAIFTHYSLFLKSKKKIDERRKWARS